MSGRDHLEALVGEQGRKLGELALAGNARADMARKVVACWR
ncbi:hypothetical protein [Serratia proteamaculans]